MSELIETESGTNIVITINAPLVAVQAAINMIAEDLGLDLELTEQEHVDAIATATKQWWFDKARRINTERVKREAEQLKTQTIEDGLEAFENSPLKGA